nr:hypothetical protein CFP56_26778 [Quercus suber]
MLSTEEQAELSRSNKKVKNVGHAGFQEGLDMPSSSHSNGSWNQTGTFKDRLMGEVPGAYTQAFSFEDYMEDDIESDDEVETLREGLVAVKFSKDLKQEMRSPWTRALIVKVYGRVGHQKDWCLYIIRQEPPVERMEARMERSMSSSPRETHASDNVKKGQGSNESASEEATDGTYGPWVVVTRRRNGTRNLTNGGALIDQVQDQPRRGPKRNRIWNMNNMGSAQPGHINGPRKEVKQKLSPIREFNGPLLASSLQRIVKAPNAWVQKEGEGSLASMGVEKGTGRTGLGKEKINPKPNLSVSVKGKKAIARARALQDNSPGSIKVAKGKVHSLTHHAQDRTTQNCDGDQQPWGSSGFQFTATPYPDLVCQDEGRGRRKSSSSSCRRLCEPDPNHRLVQCNLPANMEEQSFTDGDVHKENELNGPSGVFTRADDGDNTTDVPEPLGNQADLSSCGFTGECNGLGAEWMDLEGGDENGAGLQ